MRAGIAFAAVAAAGMSLAAMAHTPVKAGRWKVFSYDRPDRTPIVFGGWSRANGVNAVDYCVYLDIHYADGSKDWGKRADWRQGTHGWEKAWAVYQPKGPVQKIVVSVLNRKGVGKAWFRDVFLERREGKGERFGDTRMSLKPFADADEVHYCVFTGKKVQKKSERVAATISFPSPPASSVSCPLVSASSSSRRLCETGSSCPSVFPMNSSAAASSPR